MRIRPSIDPEQDRGAELALDQARQADRDQEEQHDRKGDRDDDGSRPDAFGDLLPACSPDRPRQPASGSSRRLALLGRQLRVGRDLERAEADHQRATQGDDPAHDRQAQHAVAPQRGVEREARHLDLAERRLLRRMLALGQLLGARLAHGDGPVGDTAHHHALEHRLAADRRVALGAELAVASTRRRLRSRRLADAASTASSPDRRPASGRGHRATGRTVSGPSAAALGHAALEALDAPAAVHELLPAGVERVAVRAHLDVQLVLRRAGDELVAARAAHVRPA